MALLPPAFLREEILAKQPAVVLDFIAGQALEAGEAVWVCSECKSRASDALTTVRRILG
jgi:hypothetical protein